MAALYSPRSRRDFVARMSRTLVGLGSVVVDALAEPRFVIEPATTS